MVCLYLGVATRSQSVVEEEAISDHVLHKSKALQNVLRKLLNESISIWIDGKYFSEGVKHFLSRPSPKPKCINIYTNIKHEFPRL